MLSTHFSKSTTPNKYTQKYGCFFNGRESLFWVCILLLARLFYYILKGFPNLRKKLRFGLY
jgi:hypothetical protein